jgi:hypothetical protein
MQMKECAVPKAEIMGAEVSIYYYTMYIMTTILFYCLDLP